MKTPNFFSAVINKEFLSYLTGSVLGRFSSFLLTPVLAIKLSPTDLGIYDLIITSLMVIGPIANFQIQEGQLKYALIGTTKLKTIISTTVNFSILTSLAFSAFIYLGLYIIKTDNIIHVSLIMFFGSIWPVINTIPRSLKNEFSYSLLTSLYSITFLLTIFFISKEKLTLSTTLLYIIFSYSTVIFLTLSIFNKYYKFNVLHTQTLFKLLEYSSPFIINSILFWSTAVSLRFIILYFLGAEENGVFALNFKISSVLYILGNTLYLTLQSKALKGDNIDFRNFYIMLILIYLILSIFSPLILVSFFDSIFSENVLLLQLLLLGALIQGIAILFGVKFQIKNDTKHLGTSSVFSAITGTLTAFILVPLYGLSGGALSLILGSLMLLILRKVFYEIRTV